MGLGERRDSAYVKWRFPGALAGLSLLAALGGDVARTMLRYERVGIADNELYRLLTGHFAHLGWPHLLLNLAGLGLVWVLVGSAYAALEWLAVATIVLATIDLGFWLFLPELSWYVGLSGLLHGLIVAGLVGNWPRRQKETIVILAAIVIKLAYEIALGPLPGSGEAAGGAVVTEAHLLGAMGGAIAAFVLLLAERIRSGRSRSI